MRQKAGYFKMIQKKNNWVKIFRGIHIYGGLLSMVYLLVVGVSALNFQHNFLPEQPVDTISYTQTIEFDPTLKIDSLAKIIRNELGIKGHLPPWEFRENNQGMVRFAIFRPARIYEVKLNRNSSRIHIDEIHFSLGRILRALHFGSIKNQLGDILLNIWSWYGQISAMSALLAIVSGIYLWFKYAVKSRRQWITVIASGVGSIIFILYIWLIG